MNRHNFIPLEELRFEFTKSQGAGGQNVNRRETKVYVRFKIDDSRYFSDKQKALIKEKLNHQINEAGELMEESEEFRFQAQNKKRAIEKLEDSVYLALQPVKKRIPTKPSRAILEKRLAIRKRFQRKKASRKETIEIE